MFEKSDADYVARLNNKHTRSLHLARLTRQRNIFTIIAGIMTLGIILSAAGKSDPEPFQWTIWILFLVAFYITDIEIKAVKFLQSREEQN